MPKYLDLIDGSARVAERPDVQLAITLHEWEEVQLRADLAYLESSKEREARRRAEVQELERGYALRTGWAF